MSVTPRADRQIADGLAVSGGIGLEVSKIVSRSAFAHADHSILAPYFLPPYEVPGERFLTKSASTSSCGTGRGKSSWACITFTRPAISVGSMHTASQTIDRRDWITILFLAHEASKIGIIAERNTGRTDGGQEGYHSVIEFWV